MHWNLTELLVRFAKDTPFFLALFCIPIALVFEGFFAQETRQPSRGKWLNICNLVFVSIANFIVVLFLGDLFSQAHLGLIDLRFASNTIFTSIASFLMLAFITDVFYYFYHRALHVHPHLWDIHAVHHSEEHFNVTMSVRRHWFEDPIQTLVIATPMYFLFKFPPLDLPFVMMLYSFHVYFTHMNVRLEFGRATGIITGPQLHRLHHSRLPPHIDKNFAQIFPVIDMVFGTYVAPKPNEFPPTGLDSGEQLDSAKKLLLWPMLQWKNKYRKRKSDKA